MVEGEKIVWTSALGPGYRPAETSEDCGGFPFTAIVTFEESGGGKTRYRAVALHRNEADRETHEKMGFHEGWGTCADQLGEVAGEMAPKQRRETARHPRSRSASTISNGPSLSTATGWGFRPTGSSEPSMSMARSPSSRSTAG